MDNLAGSERFKALGIDLDALLAPLSEGEGGGVWLRYEPIYQQIRSARHEDDATLPMGEWERPLVKADWKTVAAMCSDALRTRSKDLQLAAWLSEAWTHLYRIEGFVAGAMLLNALVERYWDTAWPRIDEGDSDARCAPFTWINDTLALVLVLHVPLLRIEGREPVADVNLYDWQRACAAAYDDDDNALSSESLARQVNGANAAALLQLRRQLADARDAWIELDRRLDERLAQAAPSIGQVTDALTRLAHAATSLLGDHAEHGPANPTQDDMSEFPLIDNDGAQPLSAHLVAAAAAQSITPGAVAPVALPFDAAGIVDRAHAYQLLQLVADYLARHEPHSPTPYLVRRAVGWGQMSLPELMREIVREEGDLSRYLALLEL
ncbi:type VI secretion system protein TssA [Paraburkholderia rhizosphaerae]|nr:type VI secretion system protein TssA [Paraburkholderia rhizosphaerae]